MKDEYYVKVEKLSIEHARRAVLQCKKIVAISVQNPVIAEELNFQLDYALSHLVKAKQ